MKKGRRYIEPMTGSGDGGVVTEMRIKLLNSCGPMHRLNFIK